MKDIKIFTPSKYSEKEYERVAPNIYKTRDEIFKTDCYVTSLSFVQEPKYDEGDSPAYISQYPLEDILDKFTVAVHDFYEKENQESEKVCYLEFSGSSIENIQNLLGIVGKHVYNKTVKGNIELIIE